MIEERSRMFVLSFTAFLYYCQTLLIACNPANKWTEVDECTLTCHGPCKYWAFALVNQLQIVNSVKVFFVKCR